MARAKKRPADISAVASSRPSKKRKSAKAAMVKLEEMRDAQTELDGMLDLRETTLEQQDGHEVSEDDAPAGFKKWRTTSTLVSGGPLTDVAKACVNNRTWQFTHAVEIHHREAFSLKPLIVTAGALKGHHILVLQPLPINSAKATQDFRILQLPPEIRAMIFDYAFGESGIIKISSHKPPHQPRRPVRGTFRSAYGRPSENWDRVRGKWNGQEPSALTILGVCKSVLREAAPIIYGNNTFEFNSTTDLGIFLGQIGSMREHIRTIHIDGFGYSASSAAAVFNKLKLAKQLRKISFNEPMVRLESQAPFYSYYGYRRPTVEIVCSHLASLVKILHKAQARGESSYNVLDLVQVKGKIWCWVCKERDKPKASRKEWPNWNASGKCSSDCKRSANAAKAMTKKFRRLIAESLGFEDEDSMEREAGRDVFAQETAPIEDDNESMTG